MESGCAKFVSQLVHQFLGLQVAHDEQIEEWEPREPPVTILFGALGMRIAEDFETIPPNITRRIFELIEEGISSEDESLGTAVATGLIESMVSRANRLGKLQRISREFGARSRKHAEAWWGKLD